MLIQTFKKLLIQNYRTRAIITRGLYTFHPLFEVHLRTVTFGLTYGQYSRAGYSGARMVIITLTLRPTLKIKQRKTLQLPKIILPKESYCWPRLEQFHKSSLWELRKLLPSPKKVTPVVKISKEGYKIPTICFACTGGPRLERSPV